MLKHRYIIDFMLAGRWYQPEGEVPTTNDAVVAELFDLAQYGGFDDATSVRVTRLDGHNSIGSWREVTADFLIDVAAVWYDQVDDDLAGAPAWLRDDPAVQDWLEARLADELAQAEDVRLEKLAYRRDVL